MNKSTFKKKISILVVILMLLSIMPGLNFGEGKVYALVNYGVNLVVNGDAETGDLTGWADTSGSFFSVDPSSFPSTPSSNGGQCFDFYPGGDEPASDTMSQNIDISSSATEVDAGKVKFKLSGILRKIFTTSTAEIKLEALDTSDHVLNSYELVYEGGVVFSDYYDEEPAWQTKVLDTEKVPSGTRKFRISLIADIPEHGSIDYVDFDGIWLSLEDGEAPVVGNGGAITADNATENSIDLSWSAGSDNVTTAENLQYKVVKSTSNNIDTLANAEAGTIVQDWSANLTSGQATGLSAGTTYYFNVIVKDEEGNKSVYTMISQATVPDTTVPAAGNGGAITADNATENSIDLSWSAGSDNVTTASNLQYKVVRSTSNNIDTLANAETNGITVQDWSANLTSGQATGLSAGTTYYFNVIVKDEAGNKSVYTMISQATAPDTTVPAAGNGGAITADNATENSIDLSWSAGSDNVTTASNLQYKVVKSTSNNIDTRTNA